MPSVVQRAPYELWFPPNHKIIYLVYNTLSHNKNVTALQYARYRGAGKPVIHVDRCTYYGLFLCPFNIKMYHIRKIRSRNWKSADTMYICAFAYMESLNLVFILSILYILARYALRESTENLVRNRRRKGGNLKC